MVRIKDEFYIAVDDVDLRFTLEMLRRSDRVDPQSIYTEKTTRGCTPIWWKLKGGKMEERNCEQCEHYVDNGEIRGCELWACEHDK